MRGLAISCRANAIPNGTLKVMRYMQSAITMDSISGN
jgi:hypothetical protein